MNKFSVCYKFESLYVADRSCSDHCKSLGEATTGKELGIGWGPTINVAKRRAMQSKTSIGNTNVNWVAAEEWIYKNGNLITNEW